MNARPLLVLFLMTVSTNLAFATTSTSQPPAGGQSVLKLSPPENTVREARKELVNVEQTIRDLDQKITDSHSQAAMAKTVHGSNSSQAASFQALSDGYQAQRAQLIAKRGELQAELEASK